jgi:hypothetical protein
MAPTGSSASNIGGNTWHSQISASGGKWKLAEKLGPDTQKYLLSKGEGCKTVVLDEVSLVSLEGLAQISHHCNIAKGINDVNTIFGGMHVLLCGDFYQLPTIGGTPIIKHNDATIACAEAIRGSVIWRRLTHYIELTENCRALSTNGVKSEFAKFCSLSRLGIHINYIII